MVDHTRQFRSYDPDAGEFDEDHLTNSQPSSYRFGRSARDRVPDHGVPLFLSDPEGEPDPQEFMAPLRRSRIASVTSRILVVVVAASAIAMLFAWFSSDSTRDVIINAKASIASVLPQPSAAARPLAFARTCYRHLAGRLGVAFHQALRDRAWIELGEQAVRLSADGQRSLHAAGLLPSDIGSALAGRSCLDWTERRFHLGGPLGVAITDQLLQRDWLRRHEGSRALLLTPPGRSGLRQLGIVVDD